MLRNANERAWNRFWHWAHLQETIPAIHAT